MRERKKLWRRDCFLWLVLLAANLIVQIRQIRAYEAVVREMLPVMMNCWQDRVAAGVSTLAENQEIFRTTKMLSEFFSSLGMELLFPILISTFLVQLVKWFVLEMRGGRQFQCQLPVTQRNTYLYDLFSGSAILVFLFTFDTVYLSLLQYRWNCRYAPELGLKNFDGVDTVVSWALRVCLTGIFLYTCLLLMRVLTKNVIAAALSTLTVTVALWLLDSRVTYFLVGRSGDHTRWMTFDYAVAPLFYVLVLLLTAVCIVLALYLQGKKDSAISGIFTFSPARYILLTGMGMDLFLLTVGEDFHAEKPAGMLLYAAVIFAAVLGMNHLTGPGRQQVPFRLVSKKRVYTRHPSFDAQERTPELHAKQGQKAQKSNAVQEIKKIWYRDRKFLLLMTILLALLLTAIVADEKRECSSVTLQETDWLEEQERRGANIEQMTGETDNTTLAIETEGRQFFLEMQYDDSFEDSYLLAVQMLSALILLGFLVKWQLLETGRKKEFQRMLPVQSKNIWRADALEGGMLVGLSCFCHFICGVCIMLTANHKYARWVHLGWKTNLTAIGKLAVINLMIALYVLLLLSVLMFVRELTSYPQALWLLFPLMCMAGPMLCYLLDNWFPVGFQVPLEKPEIVDGVAQTCMTMYWSDCWPLGLNDYLYSFEGRGGLHFFNPSGGYGSWPVLLALAVSLLLSYAAYRLHTKKDVSQSRVFYYLSARIFYMLLVFIAFYFVFEGVMNSPYIFFNRMASCTISLTLTLLIDWVMKRKTGA